MSEAFYRRLRATASRLIESRGRTVTIRRRGELVTGGDQPWRPDRDEPSEFQVRIVETQLSWKPSARPTVQEAEVMGVMQASLEIRESDTMVDQGKVFQFVKIKPVSPGPIVVLYEFHAAR